MLTMPINKRTVLQCLPVDTLREFADDWEAEVNDGLVRIGERT